MPIFAREYKSNAKTELERAIRELEEKKKKAREQREREKDAERVNASIDFAEKLLLISAAEAIAYHLRVEEALRELETALTTETQVVENSNTTPIASNAREDDKTAKQMTMAQAKQEIAKQQAIDAANKAQKEQENAEHPGAAPSRPATGDERTHNG